MNIPALWKAKIGNGALVIVAGTLTLTAVICVFVASVPSTSTTKSKSQIPNSLKLNEAAIFNAQSNGIDIEYRMATTDSDPIIGEVSSLYTGDSSIVDVGTHAVSGGNQGTTGFIIQGMTGSNDAGDDADVNSQTVADADGNNSFPNEDGGGEESNNNIPAGVDGSMSTNDSGGNENMDNSSGAAGSSDGTNGGTTGDTADNTNRIKSACFGGADGHCFGDR